MSFQYHCTCMDSKKIISVASNDELTAEIASCFGISSIHLVTLQVFSNDWNDWIDVEDVMQLTTKSKLNIIKGELPTAMNPILFTPSAATSLTPTCTSTPDSEMMSSLSTPTTMMLKI